MIHRGILIVQLLGTGFILIEIPSNSWKTFLLIVWWALTFWPFTLRELAMFFVVNSVFVFGDIAAIHNNFFAFSHPDILGLPLFEFFMWGFYLMHAKRFIGGPFPPYHLGYLLSAIAFILSFIILKSGLLLLGISALILSGSLAVYHTKQDLQYCAYLIFIGICIEYIGFVYNLWYYPGNYAQISAQIIIMWGGAGLYFYRLAGAFLEPLYFAQKSKGFS